MRYGLYFAPGANEAFHDLGASWLGRDAASGQAVEHPDLEGLGATRAVRDHGPRPPLRLSRNAEGPVPLWPKEPAKRT
jgi:hypothetical protein